MTTNRPPRSRVLAALVTGAATTAYYASPDLIRSRTARGWVKGALAAAGVAAGIPDMRAMIAAQQEKRAAGDAPTGALRLDGTDLPDATGLDATDVVYRAVDENRTSDDGAPAPRDLRPALVGGLVVGSLALSTVGTVAFERWVFRRGERLLAEGRPLAHTRAALVLGALMTALTLIPQEDD
ncbi:hypothetical protein AB6N23_09275 [Cellulomonas sp. 179-A 9B4 NHS]|uniref:hypothetical protein n=1 Tax=Cellulomonas sp. 179-A 9B4 NHS TaxID=3142379 RepID=UPI00399FA7FE